MTLGFRRRVASLGAIFLRELCILYEVRERWRTGGDGKWKWPLNIVYVSYFTLNKQAARAGGRGDFAKASYTQASTRSFHFSIYIDKRALTWVSSMGVPDTTTR